MQIKTIKHTIIKKMEEWLKSIKDESLREDVKKNLLVSGGSITSLLLNEKVNDFDVYLMDVDIMKRLVIYYTKPFGITIFDGRQKPELIKELEEAYQYAPGEESAIDRNNSKAISLRNLKEDQIKLYFDSASGLKVNEAKDPAELNYEPLFFSPNAISLSNDLQIVIRFYGTAEQIHKTFDFIHATNYFTFGEGLVTNINALESIITKQLKYQGSYYPVTSVIRRSYCTVYNRMQVL